MNGGTPAVEVMALDFHVLSGKSRRRLSCLVKQYLGQTVAQLTFQCNFCPSRILSKHKVERTLLDMVVRRKHPSYVPLLTKHHCQLFLHWGRAHRQWALCQWRELPGWINHDLSFITSMAVIKYAVFQTNSRSPL